MRRCSAGIGVWLPLAFVFASGVDRARAQSGDLDVTKRQTCLRDGVLRVLELREGPDGGLPCRVVYRMPGEGGFTRVMWLAENDLGFCSTRFDSFLVKLETKLAWQCEPQAVPGATDEPQAVPDATDEPQAVPDEPGNGADVPDLARATPGPASRAAAERMSALRQLMPSGAYRLVSTGEATEATERDGGSCPPGGSFFWNLRDPARPVFEMGLDAELPVTLTSEVDDEVPVEGEEPEGERDAASGGGAPSVRTFALDGARSDGQGRTIELRVVSNEEGAAGSGRVCRYSRGS